MSESRNDPLKGAQKKGEAPPSSEGASQRRPVAVSRILSGPALRPTLDDHFSHPANRAPRPLARPLMRLLPGNCPPKRTGQAPEVPCFALHRMGFFVPRRLLAGRWAVTPPFHPYPAEARRYVFCDTFRRAGLWPCAPARSTRHAAWRCSDFPLVREAPAIIRHRRRESTRRDRAG